MTATHGLCHLLGFTHSTEAEWKQVRSPSSCYPGGVWGKEAAPGPCQPPPSILTTPAETGPQTCPWKNDSQMLAFNTRLSRYFQLNVFTKKSGLCAEAESHS